MRKTVVITVNGTGSPAWDGFGFSSDVGKYFANPWNSIAAQFWGPHADIIIWQGVGYPAETFQMGASVQVGRANVLDQVRRYSDCNIVLAGYSQGALVTDFVWRDDILDPRGTLHNRLGDVIGIVNFGDPMRCPGISNGNVRAGFPVPGPDDGFTTGGIAGVADLTPAQTPDFLMSCNNDGDLYGSSPVGDDPWHNISGVGHDEQLIFDIIQSFDGKNIMGLMQEVMTTLGVTFSGGINLGSLVSVVGSAIQGILGSSGIPGIPSAGAKDAGHVVSMVQALLNGGMFVFQGMGPHGDYAKMVPAMIDFVYEQAHAHAA